MREAGLAYEVSCEPLPHPVLIDPDMWEKILLNLISNALKFTFEGKVRVSLAARGGDIELEVADTGIGIPAHELPHVFDRFHRVAGARARTQEGSGIGLALVHELARLLGGDVTVKSAVDGGTTMTVVIPARMAERPSRLAPSRARRDNRFVDEARRWLPLAPLPARPACRAFRCRWAPSGRFASWSWTTTPTCGSTWRACSPSTGRWRRPSTARPPSRQSARGAPTWCSRTS